MESKKFAVSPPFPRVEIRLPGNGGLLKGRVTAVVDNPDGPWIQVVVPTWTHWRTQLDVGQPAREGLAPGEQTMWVPGFSVTADCDDIDRITQEYRNAHPV